jgi:hypothetical protein
MIPYFSLELLGLGAGRCRLEPCFLPIEEVASGVIFFWLMEIGCKESYLSGC